MMGSKVSKEAVPKKSLLDMLPPLKSQVIDQNLLCELGPLNYSSVKQAIIKAVVPEIVTIVS